MRMLDSTTEATRLLNTEPGSEANRARAVICAIALTYSCSIAKTFFDRALDTTEATIAELQSAPLIVSTLPGIGTAVYTIGKILAILFSFRAGGKWPLISIALIGMVAALVFTIRGSTALYFIAWLPWRLISSWTWPSTMIVMLAWVDHVRPPTLASPSASASPPSPSPPRCSSHRTTWARPPPFWASRGSWPTCLAA